MADTSVVFNVLAKDKASSALKKIGTAAATALAAAAVAAATVGRDAVKAASDLAETQSKTQVLFGSSAAAVQKFADQAAKSMGQSKQEALDGAATFAVFGKGAGLAGEKLVGFSTGLTKLASDMASFSNTSPQQAIEAIGAALRGESDPMEQYGVLLSADAVAARALSMGLVKANVDQVKLHGAQIALTEAQAKYAKTMKDGNATSLDRAKASHAVAAAQQQIKDALGGSVPQLTSQQRVLATQAEIMAQTTAAQGDFARTSTGLANRQRILTAEWENAKTTLGAKLLPAMLKLVSGLQSTINYVQANRSWLVPLVVTISAFAAGIYLIVQVTKAWTIAQTALNLIMALNPIILIIMAVTALIAAIVLIALKTDWFGQIWSATWGWISSVAGAVWSWMTATAASAYAGLTSGLASVGRFFSSVWGSISHAASVAWHSVSSGATSAYNWVTTKGTALVGWFRGLPGKISGAVSGMFDGIKGAFKSAINWIIGKWNGISFTLPSINTHIPGVGRVGGFTLSTPNIPYLSVGGDVLRSGLAVIHQGERVVPAAQARRLPAGAAPISLEIQSGGSRLDDLLIELIRRAVRIRGGNVQQVLGR